MSRKVVSLVYEKRAGSAHRKAILAYFADRASDNGKGVWASKKTIADETECARSTVNKTVKEFLAEGLIWQVGERPCQNGITIVYDLNLDAIQALPDIANEPVRQADPSVERTSTDMDPSVERTPPVRQADGKTSVERTQTVLEPSLNQEEPPRGPPPEARLPSDWVPDESCTEYAANELGLLMSEIEEIADDFRGYWTERRDKKARKTADGWRRTWRNNCRRVAPEFKRNRSKPFSGNAPRNRQGSGIAGAVARRHTGR